MPFPIPCVDVEPSVEHIPFKPVKVEGGRKFRGKGYIVSVRTTTSDCGWAHTGYGWARNIVETDTARIWDPSQKKFVYANAKYVCDDDSVSAQQAKLDYDEYCAIQIKDTIDWCKSKKPDGTDIEIHDFARNVLRKHHPEIDVDTLLPDVHDTGDEIEKTICWVETLVDRCGKEYSQARRLEMVMKALAKRGITKKPDFKEVFSAKRNTHGLPLGSLD